MQNCCVLVVSLVCCAYPVLGFPYGIPLEGWPHVCSTMFPEGHRGALPSQKSSLFKIKTADTCYKDNVKLQVWIRADNEDVNILGFFIQARSNSGPIKDNSALDGKFDYVKGFGSHEPHDCPFVEEYYMKNNTWSHKGYLERDVTSFTWSPPANHNQEDIRLVATVVQWRHTYWQWLKSPVLKYSATCEQKPIRSAAIATTMTSSGISLLIGCLLMYIL